MLVLSRKLGETIVIPQLGVSVRVVEVRSGRIRLGIEAPREVPVQRSELLAQKDSREVQSLSGEHSIVG